MNSKSRFFSNSLELRLFALKRSGHHAIINWILANSKGRRVFLNNCLPNQNPFAGCNKQQSIVSWINYAAPDNVLEKWSLKNTYRLNKCLPHISRFFGFHITNNLLKFIEKENNGNHFHKEYLIYNYEDYTFREVLTDNFLNKKEKWLGRSHEEFDIIILRDPFNNFASKLKWAYGQQYAPSLPSLEKLPSLWLNHAKEAIDITVFLKNKLFINYNKWFVDENYRIKIGEKIGLDTFNKGIDEVAKYGPSNWSDSFDGMKYDGMASKMKVFERWKTFRDDQFYRSLFLNPDIWKISDKLFGKIPGTEQLK